MQITPLDIRKQEFSRRVRGDDPEEVRGFLKMLADQWEAMLDEQRRMESRLREQKHKLQHYEQVEEALQEALRTARQTARQTQDLAEQRARQTIEEAERRAGEIKRTAEEDRIRLKRETAKLSSRRNEIVARLRAFLMSEMELLAHFEGSDPVGFIKLLPSEERPGSRAGTGPQLPPPETSEEAAPQTSVSEPGEAARPGEEAGAEEEATAETSATREEPAAGATEEGDGSSSERSGPGWVVRPIITSPSYGAPRTKPDAAGASPGEQTSGERTSEKHARSDEVEKVRRILRDLD